MGTETVPCGRQYYVEVPDSVEDVQEFREDNWDNIAEIIYDDENEEFAWSQKDESRIESKGWTISKPEHLWRSDPVVLLSDYQYRKSNQ
jgi:hypothetical protein